MAAAVVVGAYVPSACAFSIRTSRPTCRPSSTLSGRCHTLKMTAAQQQRRHDDDEATALAADDKRIKGFGVGEKTLEFRDLVESDDKVDISVPFEDLVEPAMAFARHVNTTTATTAVVPTLAPMTVLRFVAPTLALWIAPPIMSLIDTSVVGRFCGASDLAALSPGCTLIDSSSYSVHVYRHCRHKHGGFLTSRRGWE